MADIDTVPDTRPSLSSYLEKKPTAVATTGDPMSIPGSNRPRAAPAAAAGGVDTSVGPPAEATAPTSPTAARPTISFNPTGTDLAQAGALRPESGPFSASNPSPLVGADAKLFQPAPSATAPSTPAGTSPVTSSPSQVNATSPATTQTTAAPASAISDSGRALGYGARVGGVNVFSDGSGGPGAPAATMTPAQIGALANGNRLSVADAGIGGNVASEAFGGSRPVAGAGPLGTTPELGSPAGLALSRPTPGSSPTNAILAKLDRDTDYAKSDAASILGKDPRSSLGTIARNAEVEGGSIGGDAGRAYTKNLTGALLQSQSGPEEGRARGDVSALENAGGTDRANINAAAEVQKAVIDKSQAGKQINLADGTLGIVGADGRVRPALDTSGKPVKPQVGKPALDTAAYGKSLEANLQKVLGIDPNTGQIPDPEHPGKFRQATPAELFRGSIQARELTNTQYGVNQAPGATKPTPSVDDDGTNANTPKDGDVHVDANGNRARWLNGTWVPEE